MFDELPQLNDYNWLTRAGSMTTVVKPYGIRETRFRNNIFCLHQMEELISNVKKNQLHIDQVKLEWGYKQPAEVSYLISAKDYSMKWLNFFGYQEITVKTPNLIDIDGIKKARGFNITTYFTYLPPLEIPFLKHLNAQYRAQIGMGSKPVRPEIVKRTFDLFQSNPQHFIQQAHNSRSL